MSRIQRFDWGRLCGIAMLLGAAMAQSAPAPTARARLPMLAVEQAIETEAGAVELPSAIGGSLSVKPCATCTTERYTTNEETRYLARGSQLTASEWQALGKSSNHAPVTVLLDARTHIVTRVLLDLAPPTRRAP